MTDEQARELMCRVGRRLFSRGLVHATAGNMSVRVGTNIIITASDACLGELEPLDLVRIDSGGQQCGPRPASKTLALHQRIYAEDPEINAVLHTHSTHLVALSLMDLPPAASVVNPITPYVVMKVGPVPVIPYHRPGDPDLLDLVVPWVRKTQGVMLERLGPVLWGQELNALTHCLDELEETARLMLLTRHFACSPLSDTQVAELRQVFQARSWNI